MRKISINKKKIAHDSWRLDISFCKWVIPRLKWLRKNKHGVPIDFIVDGDTKFLEQSSANYNKMLDEIIDGLEYYEKELDYDQAEHDKDPQAWLQKEMDFENDKRERVKHSLKLFAEYFDTLWD